MNIDSFQKISLAEAQSQGLEAVLQKIVQSLADNPDVALTRIWLIGPGDICASCSMQSLCPDKKSCLHLMASAGNPLAELRTENNKHEDWARINGHFRRIPLNTPFKVAHIAKTGKPIHIRTQQEGAEPIWISQAEWVKAQKIKSFAGLPVVFQEEVLGVLAVFSRTDLSEREFAWLRGFAEHAAEAISKVQAAGEVMTLRTNVTALEERWQSVFQKSAIGVAFSDVNGRFLDVNPAYQSILGYTEEELRNLSFYDVTPEEYRESNRALARELWAGRLDRYHFEKPYRRKDGSVVWVRLHASLVPGAGNVPRFAMALCEDITERKQAEESLRKSEERRRTLLEINNAIITKLNHNDLFHAISEALKQAVPFGRVALILRDPGTDVLRIAAMEGPFRGENFAVGHEVSPESVSRWVFNNRHPLLRKDLEKEWQYPTERILLNSGIRSLCALPLIAREEPTGVLFVVSATKGEYSEADVLFLQEVANQVALAVGNMQAYQEITALKARLEKENIYLQEEIRAEHNFEEIIGNCPALLEVLRAVEQVAPTDSTVLIQGETGTGKELIARAIHDRSPRKDRPLVRVDCGAIPAGLVESELFGHLKGAFTGALERRTGRFELADGGTIFLDEIGELPLETQTKLLRVLQEREFEQVGSSRSIQVDVRVIAATNRNLLEAVNAGQFRSDLYYRLNVFPLRIPALRDRSSDIPQLVNFFVGRFSKKFGKRLDTVSQETMDRLMNYQWPGNVRELQNVIERAMILSPGQTLILNQELLPESNTWEDPKRAVIAGRGQSPNSQEPGQNSTLEEVERAHILSVLQQTDGVIEGPRGAAKILNLHPNTLRHRMQKLGIKRTTHNRS